MYVIQPPKLWFGRLTGRIAQSGAFLRDCAVVNQPLKPHADDPKCAKDLWALSEEIVGQEFGC